MFKEILDDVVGRLQDVDGVLLMGIDGLPIEKAIRDASLNLDAITAEFTTVLRNTMLTAQEVDGGSLDEIIMLSDRMILIMKSITREYFLMMLLSPDGNLGRARFELKKAKYSLEKEFV